MDNQRRDCRGTFTQQKKCSDIKQRNQVLLWGNSLSFGVYNEKNTNNIYKKMVVHNTFDTLFVDDSRVCISQ